MLGQRRRQWVSVGSALGQCIVFAGICRPIVPLLLLDFGSEKVGPMTSMSYRDKHRSQTKNDHTNVHRPIIILTYNPSCPCDSLLVGPIYSRPTVGSLCPTVANYLSDDGRQYIYHTLIPYSLAIKSD